MTLSRLLTVCTLLALLSACSTANNSEPPAELKPIENAEFAKVLWSVDSGEGAVNKFIDMTPFILGNKIFTIDTQGQMSQRDIKNGVADWKYESGLASSSGLTGDATRLVATSLDGTVTLFDYDSKGPEKRWSHQLKSELRTRPVMDGNQLFVRSVDGKLSALDLTSGELQWSVSRRVPALSLTGSSYPVVTDELVISGFDNGKLLALKREDGSTVWEYTVSTPRGRTEIERLVDLDGQFIVRDSIIYISSFQGNLVALTLDSGQVLWTRNFSSFQAMQADAEALYLVDDKSHLWSIDRRTGSAFWKQEAFHARKLTAPKLMGDKLVVADLEGFVHWISKSDGSILARAQNSEIRYIAQPQAVDSTVIAIDISGQLSAFTQDRKRVVDDRFADQ